MRYKLLYILAISFSSYLKADCPVEGWSDFECIRYHLVNNRPPDAQKNEYRPLSYCQLMEFIDNRAHQISSQRHEAEQLFDVAYQYYSPLIFKKGHAAKDQVLDNEYSLNFLWINKSKVDENGHIMGQNNDELLLEKIISPLKNWRAMQPKAVINLWYDGALVPAKAIINTKDQLKDIVNINFHDIRDIALVKQNSFLFDARIPVYIRVDLAKSLIGDHELRNGIKYAVNIDSDIVAITKDQLFDRKTMAELRALGFVFAASKDVPWENSFIMLHNNEENNALALHEELVLKPSIDGIRSLLQQNEESIKRSGPTYFGPYGHYFKFANRILEAFAKKHEKKYSHVQKNFTVESFWNWQGRLGRDLGKFILFPKSQHGSVGYSEVEINMLRSLMLQPDTCGNKNGDFKSIWKKFLFD